ncbi:hypothetical protein P0Y35_14560 [Kiritimatiellaeota bacterium B1221]|nr:hypothetical protein [Kiritimatiellaeota bacterium B1221]
MKFSEMNKEQKQLVILGVGGAITILFIVVNLLVKPAKEAALKAEEVIAELESEVNRGQMVLDRDLKVKKEVKASAKEILEIVNRELPPSTGRYAWALANITEVFEDMGVYLDMEETRGLRYLPLKDGQEFNPDSVSMWVPYSVTVRFKTSFENLKKILNLLKEKFPYCSIAKLDIRASEQDYENHNISLILEWPVFRFDSDQAWMEKQAQ